MAFKMALRGRGLSDEAFREAFGLEGPCRTALVRLRWPGGFVSPACGHRGHCVLMGRGLYQCNRCKKQTSPTAGTIFHATKLPLTLWFAAIHLIVTAKNGVSSVELGRHLGVMQPTAWAMKHKIMAVMCSATIWMRAGYAPKAAHQALPLLLFHGHGLRALYAQERVSVEGASNKAVVIGNDYPALLRARRRHVRWSA